MVECVLHVREVDTQGVNSKMPTVHPFQPSGIDANLDFPCPMCLLSPMPVPLSLAVAVLIFCFALASFASRYSFFAARTASSASFLMILS